ncbi:hypothetical protein V8E36_001674 [Tilletia maclaganii]
MQLRLSFVLAAVVLTTGIAASSAPQGEGMVVRAHADTPAHRSLAAPVEARMSKASVESQAATIAKAASKQIKADLAVLHGLEKKENPTKAEANKAFAELNTHLATFGKQYDALAKKYAKSKKDSRDLVERQALLQPAIKDLTAQLKKLLPQVRILARNLTTRLGLNTVSVIIKQITPGLRSIDSGLYQILNVLGDDLGPGLVDPLLRTVYGLLDGLGLNLNARELEISEEAFEARAEPTKASIKAEAAVSFKQASSLFKGDIKVFNKLLAQEHVSKKEFAAAIKAFEAHAAATTKEIKHLKKEAHAAGIESRAAQPADFVGAVNGLVADLNKALPIVRTLIRTVVADLELNAVNQLLTTLEPTLAALVGGLEGLLIGLAPTLAALVNPLLGLVTALTRGLGIELNGNSGQL